MKSVMTKSMISFPFRLIRNKLHQISPCNKPRWTCTHLNCWTRTYILLKPYCSLPPNLSESKLKKAESRKGVQTSPYTHTKSSMSENIMFRYNQGWIDCIESPDGWIVWAVGKSRWRARCEHQWVLRQTVLQPTPTPPCPSARECVRVSSRSLTTSLPDRPTTSRHTNIVSVHVIGQCADRILAVIG